MNKIKALYVNEMIKISRKYYLLGIAIATVIISLSFPFLLRYVIYELDFSSGDGSDPRAYMEADVEEAEKRLKNSEWTAVNKDLTIETDGKEQTYSMTLYTGPDDLPFLLSQKNSYGDMLANYDFDRYPIDDTFLSEEASASYRNFEEDLIDMQMTPFEERDAVWLEDFGKKERARDLVRKALMEHDFMAYCDGLDLGTNKEDLLSADPDSFRERYGPKVVRKLAASDPAGELGVEDSFYMMVYIYDIDRKQSLLDSGLKEKGKTPRILTEEDKEILSDSIKILKYKFDRHNMYDEQSSTAVQLNYTMGNITQYGLIILLMLTAGSSVSMEMATGSIKSLIIAPVRRWKIYIAKLLSIITVMLMASVLITLFNFIGTGLAFGFDKLPPYMFVSGGTVQEMPFLIAKILMDLVQNIPAFFYAFVAFMISCFTKNTGISVGLSTGLLLFHEVPLILTASDVPQRIMDFTPVANMDLMEKCFPYVNLMVSELDFTLFSGYGFSNPLWFSIVYIIVLLIAVLFTAFEEFVKKDIQ